MKTKRVTVRISLVLPADSDVAVRDVFREAAESVIRGSLLTLDDDAVDDVGYVLKVRER